MHTQTTAPAGVVLKPVRLNFAQFCLWCGERWCQSQKCVDLHDQSVWQVCSECDGSQVGGCPCAGGLMEVPAPSSRVAQLLAEATKNLPAPKSAGRPELVCYGSDADDLMYVWELR